MSVELSSELEEQGILEKGSMRGRQGDSLPEDETDKRQVFVAVILNFYFYVFNQIKKHKRQLFLALVELQKRLSPSLCKSLGKESQTRLS